MRVQSEHRGHVRSHLKTLEAELAQGLQTAAPLPTLPCAGEGTRRGYGYNRDKAMAYERVNDKVRVVDNLLAPVQRGPLLLALGSLNRWREPRLAYTTSRRGTASCSEAIALYVADGPGPNGRVGGHRSGDGSGMGKALRAALEGGC